MTKEQVICLLKNHLGYSFADYYAVVRIRHTNSFLPEYGNNGSLRDKADWALIDMTEKIDSEVYGAIYYFKENTQLESAF